jgi:hypothetical protein
LLLGANATQQEEDQSAFGDWRQRNWIQNEYSHPNLKYEKFNNSTKIS